MKKIYIFWCLIFWQLNLYGQSNIGPIMTFNPAGGELINLTPTITAYISDPDGVDYQSLKIKWNGVDLNPILFQVDQSLNKIVINLNEENKLILDSNIFEIEINDKLGNVGTGAVGFDRSKDIAYNFITVNDSTASLNRSQCVILENGILKCFGFNSNGQLGTGTNQNIGDDEKPAQMNPVNIPEKVIQVASGNRHTCAVTENGNLYCFGNNSFGQLGVGSTIGDLGSDFYHPMLIDVGNKVKRVSAGYAHTCVILANGHLKCFGWNGYNILGQVTNGQIGDNETPSSLPEINLGEPVIQVTTGWQFTCILVESGRVKCFGNNQLGQLGLGTQSFNLKSAMETPYLEFPNKVIEIASSYVHTCALLADFSVYCFGKNQLGQLGLGHTQNIGDDEPASFGGPLPFEVPVVKVSVGGTHSCALLINESVKCWGENNFNQLGYGHTQNLGDNETISSYGYVNLGGAALDVSLGDYVSYARLKDGRFKAWGENAFGELGLGLSTPYFVTQTPADLPSVELGGVILETLSHTYLKLTAFFEVDQYFGASPFLISFDATKSVSGLSQIKNYHYDFGNGESIDSLQPIVQYTYFKNGVYKVVLTITDQYQYQAKFERTITVGHINNPPLAFLKYLSTDLIAGEVGFFDATESFDVNGQIIQYQYHFGDGQILNSSSNRAEHIYGNSGNFLAFVKVTDNDLSSSESLPILINVRPINMAPFANLNCEIDKKLVTCDGMKSADLDGSIVKYQFKVGGVTFESSHPGPFKFRARKYGLYQVQLTVWDNLGVESKTELNIEVKNKAEHDDKKEHSLKNFEFLKWQIKNCEGDSIDLREFNKKISNNLKIISGAFDKKGNFFYVNQSGELWKKSIHGPKNLLMKQLVLPIALGLDADNGKLYLFQNHDKKLIRIDLFKEQKREFFYSKNCSFQRECEFIVDYIKVDEDQNLFLINFPQEKQIKVQLNEKNYQKLILNEVEKLKLIFQLDF